MNYKQYTEYLKPYKEKLSKQQYDTLRGKLKQDDVQAVEKGLNKILSK